MSQPKFITIGGIEHRRWRDSELYVSRNGHLIGVNDVGRQRPITSDLSRQGILIARYQERGRQRSYPLHLIVWESWHGLDESPAVEILFRNDQSDDVRLENLIEAPAKQRDDANRRRRERRADSAVRTTAPSIAAKLTPGQVRQIRSRYWAGESVVALAEEFGVTRSSVYNIVNHTTWTDLKNRDEPGEKP
jgi:hypothetical protein